MNRRIAKHVVAAIICLVAFSGCESDKKSGGDPAPRPSTGKVENLKAVPTRNKLEISVDWTNPTLGNLKQAELVCKPVGGKVDGAPILLEAKAGTVSTCTFSVKSHGDYVVEVTPVDEKGVKYTKSAVTVTPLKMTMDVKDFIRRADIVMDALYKNFWGGPRNNWRDYPPTGQYWDKDLVVWDQGGGFSAFAALREAASKDAGLTGKYSNLEQTMITSIDKFKVYDNKIEGYSVYPQAGNDRYFDDNLWIGIDMTDLYILTGKQVFLDRAKTVWNYILTGTDADGGVYWRELKTKSTTKHTCSTAPRAVMGAKLYLATGDGQYLDASKRSYQFCIDKLLDRGSWLMNDNIGQTGKVSADKWIYNSGQVIQAGALLFRITREVKYLEMAQKIARSAYGKWFGKVVNSTYYGRKFNFCTSDNVWFTSVALRGFIELYRIDGNREYIDSFENMLAHAWESPCRNTDNNLLNYSDFTGNSSRSSWSLIHEAATVEMIARLGSLAWDEEKVEK